MEINQTYLHPQMAVVLNKILDITVTILLMMGAFPLLKKLLIMLLMQLYEVFIRHQYLF